jgi:CPA2 family monovalent cation:H+ antiporter-2
MVADPILFRDLAFVFVAAVVGGALAWLARQPPVLGYVVGGILISPLTPGPAVSDPRTFEAFAEIGVILLLFSIGIEFPLHELKRVGWVAILGGPVRILLTIGLGMGVGQLLGWPLLQGVVVGTVVSVASTTVLARLLLDRGELHSRHGRLMIAIVLVEDLAVVVMTVLVPALGAFEPGRLLAIAVAFGKAALILVPFSYLAGKVIPALLARVARTQSEELFLLVALAIGIGTAALTHAVGLSLALGAFLAGLLISESDYAHETLARVLSVRDAFVALFFVTIGALIDPATLVANLPLLGAMIGLVLVGKLVIGTAVVWLFRYPLSTAALVGIGLTQIGEFSFVLVAVARDAGHVGTDVYNATLAASLITILANALLVRYGTAWIGAASLARSGRGMTPAPERPAPAAQVIICGFGRVGSVVGEALETFRVPYTVIELDPDVAKRLRARGVHCLFGDAVHRQLLVRAGAEHVGLVVVTLPEFARARLAVQRLRGLNPSLPILARAHSRGEAESLREVGATEVIQPELEASATMVRHALAHLALPKGEALAYLERFRDAMASARLGPEGDAPDMPEVRELVLGRGGVADQSLREARIRERFGVTIVAIRRSDGRVLLNPAPETVLHPGDRVRVFGLPAQIEAFLADAVRPD